MDYELFYWDGIPGRGEFIRLAFEAREIPFVERTDVKALQAKARPAYAPPVLRHGEVIIGQTSAILRYLGPALGLSGETQTDVAWVDQLQLTIQDIVLEAHNTHHPLSPDLYYEDQRAEALRAAHAFRTTRLVKYFAWLAMCLERSGGPFLLGESLSYADLSLFQLVQGLIYAFPQTMTGQLAARPGIARHAEAVARIEPIAAYLASPRRRSFNEDGLFRAYPELDAA